MKINHILIFIILLFSLALQSQQLENKAYKTETISLFSERSIYIAGENLQFKAVLFCSDTSKQAQSEIIYCEIISPEGKSVLKGKFLHENFKVSASFNIPDDILSGTYYLRAYTKLMRNIGPEAYAYLQLKIINPLRTELANGTDSFSTPEPLAKNNNAISAFSIKTDKPSYSTREKVVVSIATLPDLKDDFSELSLAVVPELAAPKLQFKYKNSDHQYIAPDFYPENKGLTITGILKDSTGEQPLAGLRVNLSIIGHGRDFMAMQTDSSGRYFFSLPAYTGQRDLFISAENAANIHPKVLVDNDFCALPIQLPVPLFAPDEAEKELIYQMAVNTQVDRFYPSDSSVYETDDRIDKAFYGLPLQTLVIANYVALPTLEEYFNELPTSVKVRKRNGKKYFKVLGDQAEMAIYDPLVLVDWVAMDDPERILKILPQNLNRIEIINVPYIKGNITYGGVVSIISNRGDFAGIDLPSSGIFINFLFLSEKHASAVATPKLSHLPDARNTLLWEPNFVFEKKKTTEITFQTPDSPGCYMIVLQGITKNREAFLQKQIFEVNN